MALYDREAECALIDRLIEDARAGRSVVLVVRGDPGLGKSSLIEYAAGRADGSMVLACRGFEAESQLAFAGLGDLLRPLAEHLDVLPEAQRAALEGVLSVGPPTVADRLTLNVGVLSLLAAAAEHAPLLLTVDDAHWLDAASLEALAFAARRLEADRIAMLVAVRSGEQVVFTTDRFEILDLQPIGPAAARRLLTESADSTPVFMDRVIELAGGNPLAVIELARHLEAEPDLLDHVQLPAGRVQQAFMSRVLALTASTQRALVVAAAAADADALLLGRALAVHHLELVTTRAGRGGRADQIRGRCRGVQPSAGAGRDLCRRRTGRAQSGPRRGRCGDGRPGIRGCPRLAPAEAAVEPDAGSPTRWSALPTAPDRSAGTPPRWRCCGARRRSPPTLPTVPGGC